ncbi:MAG: beta-lactamase family protein [Gammaproteobacteria bacterium]|nr:beta-lactamase family protein [Gammaproteobacteria bacterium]MBU1443533.1 beta-lactamase family protein [Gammaproteobacteria bacterium]MBU2286901.1 beta-lactamase family protein [Gammaproteobacteria bacterium]MBU2409931.1 beta-lactamase family protein [Gammaproteobacteria bacterium]
MTHSLLSRSPRAMALGLCAVAAVAPMIARATDLPTASPESMGVDSRPLVQLSEMIRKENLDVRSLLVVKDGQLVFERYAKGLTRDHNYEMYSITKNVTALAAGALVDEGKTRLDEKVAPILAKARPDLKDALADKQGIELRHVMSMSTGLVYNFKPTDDPIYYGAPDRLRLAAETTPKVAPGTAFDYTDVNPILASATLGADAGMPLQDYARSHFFEPMGMTHYGWERADDKGLVSSGWGLRLRAVDMAKLGMLVLHGGRWEGRQLVSQAWVRTMTAPSSAPWYGLYWWINDIVATEPETHAMGFKGQFIVSLPERNAVVVMTSMLPIEGGLRESQNVLAIRRMVKDYVLPALDNKAHATPSIARSKALAHELQLAGQHQGKPAAPADATDTPRL